MGTMLRELKLFRPIAANISGSSSFKVEEKIDIPLFLRIWPTDGDSLGILQQTLKPLMHPGTLPSKWRPGHSLISTHTPPRAQHVAPVVPDKLKICLCNACPSAKRYLTK